MQNINGIRLSTERPNSRFGFPLFGEASTIDNPLQPRVIGAGTPASRIVERLGTTAVDQLLARLFTRFDLVIFDAPPAVVAGDAQALAGRVDAAALVIQAGEEERGLVGRLVRQFASTTRLVGIVLNRPRGTAGGYFRKNFDVMANYARARR